MLIVCTCRKVPGSFSLAGETRPWVGWNRSCFFFFVFFPLKWKWFLPSQSTYTIWFTASASWKESPWVQLSFGVFKRLWSPYKITIKAPANSCWCEVSTMHDKLVYPSWFLHLQPHHILPSMGKGLQAWHNLEKLG